ncbi:S8 family peptidase [Paenibacillus sp. 481]|uniref:S8 family peptidase n=1 Tax=Paenibacillus sp. 481 TaxID=2835869 RepID=UPI001E2ECFD1|nr:S8 family serine peptidase [Paenibacillus sp. 481]UHA75677.1 S8 family serine peptidase [Paenibacillus sp. 481]
MMIRWRRARMSCLIAALVLMSLFVTWSIIGQFGQRDATSSNPPWMKYVDQSTGAGDAQHNTAATSWIVKWKHGNKDERLLAQSELIDEQPEVGISVIRPNSDSVLEDWISALKQSKHVEYVHPNHQVNTLSPVSKKLLDQPELNKMLGSIRPNDVLYGQQHYLRQIGVDRAWSRTRGNSHITIALVDTGVDLDHPDLQMNLVKGVNLLESGPPQDDNGHGTSVAGVLAAVGNNNKGTTGVMWSSRIMPIKALDDRGSGDEDKLGAGIIYAVDHGAKIVVMSVGLYRYSPYMQDIVNYAEKRGVLLIAATGNDGVLYQDKVAVKYPAAYPTVLAVGGMTPQKKVEPRSNTGAEVDLVAPWHVFTTWLGGSYKADEGTSMAAPQVAGVAALVWSRHPHLKPYQIRQHLQATAEDIEEKGRDYKSGFGLVRADKALTTPPTDDALATHELRSKAQLFPIDTSLSSVLSDGKDRDWYTFDAPYDGTLSLQYQRVSGTAKARVTHYVGDRKSGTTYRNLGHQVTSIPVKKGKNMLKVVMDPNSESSALTYKLASRFIVHADPFEPNDKQFQAYTLSARAQQVEGTFSHVGDMDWYVIQVPTKGTLRLKMTSDTVRIDPALELRSASGSSFEPQWIDDHDEGQSEMIVLPDLQPGKYYILAQNAVTARPSPAAGGYKLNVEFITQHTDLHEPNDKMYQAVTISEGTEYTGVFAHDNDTDWFQFRTDKLLQGAFQVDNLPSNRTVSMVIMDKQQKQLGAARNQYGETSVKADVKLVPGTYYIRLNTNYKFDTRFYHFFVKTSEPIAEPQKLKSH